MPGPVYVYGHSFGAEAATRANNLARWCCSRAAPKPWALVLIPEEFIVRLEKLAGAGEQEQAVMVLE
jgi:hypothetical protein